MVEANLPKGSVVYVYEHWSKQFVKATTEQYCPKDNAYTLRYESIVSPTGEEIVNFGGNSARRVEDIWSTIELAHRNISFRDSESVKKYAKEINNIVDLVKFPLTHSLCGEEYTDMNAIKAYKMRALELIGVEL